MGHGPTAGVAVSSSSRTHFGISLALHLNVAASAAPAGIPGPCGRSVPCALVARTGTPGGRWSSPRPEWRQRGPDASHSFLHCPHQECVPSGQVMAWK